MKLDLTKVGYYQVNLCINSNTRKHLVHRLVAKAFILNFKDKPEVNHKDGIKIHNEEYNLEWCTAKENSKHADIVLGIDNRGENFGGVKLTNKQVYKIRTLLATSNLKQEEIVKMFSIDQTTVSDIKQNRTWKHI